MHDEFERRVSGAAVAGWWVVLLAAILLTLSWIAYLIVIPAQPEWMLRMWGADMAWTDIQRIWLWAIVVFKLTIWVMACGALWATLWARRLRRVGAR